MLWLLQAVACVGNIVAAVSSADILQVCCAVACGPEIYVTLFPVQFPLSIIHIAPFPPSPPRSLAHLESGHSGTSVAKFIVPDWGDKVDSGIGLSYRPARRLHRLAGRYDHPMPESTLSPNPYYDFNKL